MKKPKVNDASSSQVSVEHDPAVRSAKKTKRSTWLNMGLFSWNYLVITSQSRYTSEETELFFARWYNEYPHLEYSITKNAVFCFVCSLFHNTLSKENADPSCMSEIVGHDIPYITCQAHCNTVIKHSCNTSVIVHDMFDILQALFVFFTSSTKLF